MNEESYPRVYEGEALRPLNLKPPFAEIVRRIQVASETTMIVDLDNRETITVDVHAPAGTGRSWTMTVTTTRLGSSTSSIVAEAHPIKDGPSLPDGDVISTAVELALIATFREYQQDKMLKTVAALMRWIGPGVDVVSPLFAKAAVDGHVTVGYERTATSNVISLRIEVPGPWGPAPSDLFR